MHPFQFLLVLYVVMSLIGLVLLVRWERRSFQARGLEGPWRTVRLSTIPIALLSSALVLMPARSIAGMEGLAVFYLLLIAAAPIFWFASHWIVGGLLKPSLSFRDSARIAGSPLLYLIVLALVAQQLQAPVWATLRALGVE